MGVREKAITVLALDYDNTLPNLISTHSHVYMCVGHTATGLWLGQIPGNRISNTTAIDNKPNNCNHIQFTDMLA